MDSPSIPFDTLVQMEALRRPAHGYCISGAARLAKRMGHDRVAVAEFGVAGGRTLLIIEEYAKRLSRELGIAIEVYGFDTAEGLSTIEGAPDLPYWFKANQFRMDVQALKSRLTDAKLVLGNIRDTIPEYVRLKPAPLGAIFCDVDLWSSTKYTLDILKLEDRLLLPRIFVYMDDVTGSEWEMYCPLNGELCAIEEFNSENALRKIYPARNLRRSSFADHIFYAHLQDHPDYSRYIGGNTQEEMEGHLRL
jgi:hypothetical protein